MSDSVKRHMSTFKVLSKAPKKLRTAVIENSTRDLILALCEVIHNVLIGSVKLKPAEIKKLRRYRHTLAKLTKKSTPVKQKKILINQQGGFLLTLLPPAIALLSTLLA